MKFLTFAAAIATAAAVRMRQVPVSENLLAVEKEIPDPEDVWKHFDADNSGTWNMTEAKKAFNATFDYFNQTKPDDLMHEVEKGFNETDTDGNGEVTPEELGVYLFKQIDSNSDGLWEKKEVFQAIKNIAQFTKNRLRPGWRKMVADVMEKVDTDNDGKVSPKEVFAALKLHGIPDINDLFLTKEERKQKRAEAKARKERGAHEIPNPVEVWEQFDTNNDDKWEWNEAKKAYKAAFEHFNYTLPENWKRDAKDLFKKIDHNKDGFIVPKEFGVFIFQQVDKNGDGMWSIDEVKQAIRNLAQMSGNKLKEGWQKHVKDAFKDVDTSGDGLATMEEVFGYIEKNGFPNVNDLFE